jgi:NADH-quinone oxidoreductase subunit C
MAQKESQKETPQEILAALGEHIVKSLPQTAAGAEVAGGELVVHAGREEIATVLKFLRDDAKCKFRMLIDITAVDYPQRAERFEVVYHLLSLSKNQRVRVKVNAAEDEQVPTATGVYSAAEWFEREVWDMFGIFFKDHPDLRRILTDYGFDGHPLRKEFPLTGYTEVRYDSELRRVVYEPVKLTQDFRRFDFENPWEAMTGVQLPGDEKAVKPKYGWVSTRDSGKE